MGCLSYLFLCNLFAHAQLRSCNRDCGKQGEGWCWCCSCCHMDMCALESGNSLQTPHLSASFFMSCFFHPFFLPHIFLLRARWARPNSLPARVGSRIAGLGE